MKERYANKRMMFRKGGKFSKAPSLERMGFDVNKAEQTCANCGHKWFPVLATGLCPQCDTALKPWEVRDGE